jgi:hypothetical protein
MGTISKGVFSREHLPNRQRLWDDCIQKETWEESKSNKKSVSKENFSLVSKTRKGKGKGSSNKGNNDGGSSQPGKNKELSKIKYFSCHKNGHHASQCLKKKKKGNGNMQTTSSTKT